MDRDEMTFFLTTLAIGLPAGTALLAVALFVLLSLLGINLPWF